MKKSCFVILLSLCGALLCVSAEGASSTVTSLKAIYDRTLSGIQDESLSVKISSSSQYQQSIKQYQTTCQKRGDLEKWQIVDQEVKRFAKERKVSADNFVNGDKTLLTIQERHVKTIKSSGDSNAKKVVDFTDKYCKRLLEYQTKFTKAGNIEEAIDCSNEIKRVKQEDAYVSAKRFLEKKEAPAEPASEEIDLDDVPEGEEDIEAAEAEPTERELPDGYTMYRRSDGVSSLSARSKSFKPIPFRKAGSSPLSGGISCKVSMSRADRASKDSSSKSVSITHAAKISLRTSKSYEDPKVIIQYFSRGVGSSGDGRSMIDSVVLPVPVINSDEVYFECPPFTLSKYSSGSSSSEKSGSEFEGVLVTVFDSDHKLIYQGASQQRLEEEGASASIEIDASKMRDEIDAVKSRCEEAYKTYKQTHDSKFYYEYKDLRNEFEEMKDRHNDRYPDKRYSGSPSTS